MLDSQWAAARNLLLLRLDNLGDVVLLSAAIRTIRERLPRARLTLMASPAGSQAAPLLPWLDDVIVWRALWQDLGGTMPLDPAREMELVGRLCEGKFDAAIVFTSFSQSPHGPAYACYLAGIPLRLGESKEFGGGLLTTEIRGLPDGLHQAERSLRMLEGVGFEVRDRRPRVVVPQGARENASGLLLSHGIAPGSAYVMVHPGASCQARRYPLERFAAVARLLTRRLDRPVLLSGSAKEAPALEEIAAQSQPGLVSVAGRTRVEEMAAVVAGASLVLCNDSLPMHLCDALGVPCLALYSGTDLVSQWAPLHAPARVLQRETNCSPCYLMTCPYHQECLEFSPHEVVEAAEEMLSAQRSPLPLEGGRRASRGRRRKLVGVQP